MITQTEGIRTIDAAWVVGDVNCTVSADTQIYKVGTASAKMSIAAGATAGVGSSLSAGVQAGFDIGDENMASAGWTEIKTWMYASTAIAASAFQFGLSEQAKAASTPNYQGGVFVNIPAIPATTWTRVTLPMAPGMKTMTSASSLLLNMLVDVGAIDIWIDDVRFVKYANDGATRGYVKQTARHFLDELSPGRLVDSTDGQFGLDAAVDEAYIQYAKAVKCFRSDLAPQNSVATQAIYDHLTFDASNRLFEIYAARYNGVDLRVLTVEELDGIHPYWRTGSAGTPAVLVPWDEGRFRLYPTPSAVASIAIDGYLLPDLTTFTEDTDVLDLQPSRAIVIAAGTAVIASMRFADVPSQQLQKSDCYGLWTEGIKTANREVHGVAVPVLGRSRTRANVTGTGSPIYSIHNDLII